MTFRVFTISGEVASGTSSIAETLLALLPNWHRVNTGQRFRDFCTSQGMTIQQVSQIPDEIHIAFDTYQSELMRSGKELIIEGRLTGWLACEFVDIYRVYCWASLDIRIERYIARHSVRYEQAVEDIAYRDSCDVVKFREMYGISDYRSPQFYDLMLDTSRFSPEELADIITRSATV